MDTMQEDRLFLSLGQVLTLHQIGIDRYSPGESKQVREQGLLESAVYSPQQTFSGSFLYPSLIDMAAAYMVGLCQNHAFINGNKRVAYMACNTFLRMNGYTLKMTQDEAVDLTLRVASHQISREELAPELEKFVVEL